MLITIIGFLAGLTSTISLLPQIYKTYTSKTTRDLSAIMLINFALCSLLWIIYGFLTNSMSVTITNIVMLICSVILVYFKLRYQ
ncbi:MAG: hypothetical protein KBC27_03130 [Rickettsiales bacterium]|nr:hypothetical protein [Rickettsiales bacterium]